MISPKSSSLYISVSECQKHVPNTAKSDQELTSISRGLKDGQGDHRLSNCASGPCWKTSSKVQGLKFWGQKRLSYSGSDVMMVKSTYPPTCSVSSMFLDKCNILMHVRNP